MIKYISITATLLLLSHASVAPTVYAQPAGQCQDAVNKYIAREHRTFRAALFGLPKPEDARIGLVMYSKDGDAWIKVADNKWQSLAKGFEFTTWSDTLMEDQMEIQIPDDEDKIKGIYETKRMLSSELLPYVASAVRTFQCRLDILCAAVSESQEKIEESTDPTVPRDITIHLAGCEEIDVQTIPECHPSPATGGNDSNTAFDGQTYCTDVARDTLTREADLIKMITEYDASYRSTLQFAGDFDLFIDQMRWPLTNTVRQAASMIGQMNRIPCFLASCEDFPPDFEVNAP